MKRKIEYEITCCANCFFFEESSFEFKGRCNKLNKVISIHNAENEILDACPLPIVQD